MIARTPEQAVECARRHDIPVDATLGPGIGGPRVALHCPICRNGQWVIVEWDYFGVSGCCHWCQSTAFDVLWGLRT